MKRDKFFISFLPAIIFLFVLPQSVCIAAGESKTLNTIKDTYANQAYPDQNRGTINSIIVSNKFTTRLGYLQFEDLNLPEGAILDQGILNFYVSEVHYSDRAKVNIGPITGNWEETTVTWNNKPTINQAQAIEVEFSLTAAGWRELDVTPLVRWWLGGTTENRGIFIYPYGFLYGAAETEYAFTLKSKESGTQRANIVAKYHFEPSPSPSPKPSPSPEVEPTEEPEEEAVIGEEEPSPTPEESPSPSPEAEEGKILGIFTPGQAIIGGLILLALIGAGISFAAYARRKPKKKAKKKVKPEEKEPEEKEEE